MCVVGRREGILFGNVKMPISHLSAKIKLESLSMCVQMYLYIYIYIFIYI